MALKPLTDLAAVPRKGAPGKRAQGAHSDGHTVWMYSYGTVCEVHAGARQAAAAAAD